MHNVNILTIHKEPNYGAVLQAYALYKTIENLGHVPTSSIWTWITDVSLTASNTGYCLVCISG